MQISRPRGTSDILPEEARRWRKLENVIHELCRLYGYGEIRTPIFETTDLFLRGVGEATDIVEKEMYTFKSKGKRANSLTLRPEGTAPVARAYLENGLYALPQPVKLYYIGPMFRYDRPQAGRYRQFHQFGAEIFGADDPAADAEVIALAMTFFKKLGLKGLELHLNSVGCPECRPVMREKLVEYFNLRIQECCQDCRNRLVKNPLRILDCKEDSCREIRRGAPSPVDCLCTECGAHFEHLRRYLDLLNIPYHLNPRLVRGLDYYTKTAFEIIIPGAGAQDAVGGGGRYDGLVQEIGGRSVPGVGFALGLERTLLLMLDGAGEVATAPGPEVFVVTAGETRDTATRLVADLRAAGLVADRDYTGRSLKAQMKYAGKLGARYVVIVGEDELRGGRVALKDMEAGRQTEVYLEEMVDFLRRAVGK